MQFVQIKELFFGVKSAAHSAYLKKPKLRVLSLSSWMITTVINAEYSQDEW